MRLIVDYIAFALDDSLARLFQGYMLKYGFSGFDGSGYDELVAISGSGTVDVIPYPVGSGIGAGNGTSYGEAGINMGLGFGSPFHYAVLLPDDIYLSDFKALLFLRFKE